LHDISIDEKALASAFPFARMDCLAEDVKDSRFVYVNQCRRSKLPIFVISFNRGKDLLKVVDSYRKLDDEIDIIVHDNGSDDRDTLDILKSLENTGTKIFWKGRISTANELNNVNDSIQEYFRLWCEPSRYIVTDCDIDMSIASTDSLKVYNELLDSFRKIQCVGPMLRIMDIPKEYGLYNHVMNRHIEQFWQKEPQFTETSIGKVAFITAKIDTTFSMHRAGDPFTRLKEGIRVYYPYEAMHLDWYETSEREQGNSYFISSSETISHWNNESFYKKNKNASMQHEGFWYVGHDDNLELIVKRFNF